jgi:hypothetical protein
VDSRGIRTPLVIIGFARQMHLPQSVSATRLTGCGTRLILRPGQERIITNESDAVDSVEVSARDAAITSLQQLRLAHSKL